MRSSATSYSLLPGCPSLCGISPLGLWQMASQGALGRMLRRRGSGSDSTPLTQEVLSFLSSLRVQSG